MTALDQFIANAQELKPSINIAIDRPADEQGDYWLDVTSDDFETTLLWRADRGFGFYSSETAYGDKPDELYKKPEMAAKRLEQLMESSDEEISSQAVPWLKDLRTLIDIPQTTLADRLAIQQAAVSRLESRDDIKLSSLLAYMDGLGVRLKIKAYNDDFEMSVPVVSKPSIRQIDID